VGNHGRDPQLSTLAATAGCAAAFDLAELTIYHELPLEMQGGISARFLKT